MSFHHHHPSLRCPSLGVVWLLVIIGCLTGTFLPAAFAYEVRYAKTGYQVTSGMDYAIRYELKKLIAGHERAFGRPAPTDFKITYYIYPSYSSYKAHALKDGQKVTPELLGYTQSNSMVENSTGKILSADVEVVTWRQAQPAVLTATVLHESAHAVTRSFLLQVPLWMNEGSADWFGQPAWANGTQQQLDRAQRWQTLNAMLDAKKLPSLRPYLITENYDDWSKMFGGDIGMGYVVGYSIFDFFMASPNAQQLLTQLIGSEAIEFSKQPEAAFTAAIDKTWPGGINAFERSWHIWIKRKAAAELLTMQQKLKQQAKEP